MLSTQPEERRARELEREVRALKDVGTRRKVAKYDRIKKKLWNDDDTHLRFKRTLKGKYAKGHKSATHAARAELIYHQEKPGLIDTDGMEKTYELTQEKIVEAAPLAARQQYFNLSLNELGPYSINYSRSGRYLLLGGQKGHLASFDWRYKKLECEVQVQQATRDIHYLHTEKMFAAAQKNFVYIYDNSGTEIHCMKKMECVNKLTFLPHHFLLVSASEFSCLAYLDVSIGQFVVRHWTGLGPLRTLCHNPHNGVIHLGHHNGTVTLWTPNMKKPAVKMLCHRGHVNGIAMDREGRYMVTTGMDAQMKVWDIRQYKPLHGFYTHRPASSLDISQRGLVALGYGTRCEIWQDVFANPDRRPPYLKYHLPGELHHLQFCPYEDCLGIGHSKGFTSIIVPGAGEPNIDALEVNPYQTKTQRQEWEVKSLLEKIPAELIMLDPHQIVQFHDSKNEKEETTAVEAEANKATYKLKKKGRSTPRKMAAKKQLMKDKIARALRQQKVRADKVRAEERASQRDNERQNMTSILDRFK